MPGRGRERGSEGQRAGARARQVAALPLRRRRSGRLEVLLITSRDTGRWVLPKGWPMAGLDPWEAAAVEALEEAGAEGAVTPAPIGTYDYGKRLDDGGVKPCRVTLYPLRVTRLRDQWKEADERERRWFDPKEAAKRVDEPDLGAMLRDLAGKKAKLPKASHKA